MINSADKFDNNLYVYQGCILDKFLCTTKQGGPHLYLTKNLKVAREKLNNSDHGLRPESKIYHEMAKESYDVIKEKKIFALHDFFQSHEDVYRKGFFHGIKHKPWKRLIPLWLEKSQSENDYKIGSIGFIDGYFSEQNVYPKIEELKKIAHQKIKELNIDRVVKSEIRNVDFNNVMKFFSVKYDDDLNILIKKKPFFKRVRSKLK